MPRYKFSLFPIGALGFLVAVALAFGDVLDAAARAGRWEVSAAVGLLTVAGLAPFVVRKIP